MGEGGGRGRGAAVDDGSRRVRRWCARDPEERRSRSIGGVSAERPVIATPDRPMGKIFYHSNNQRADSHFTREITPSPERQGRHNVVDRPDRGGRSIGRVIYLSSERANENAKKKKNKKTMEDPQKRMEDRHERGTTGRGGGEASSLCARGLIRSRRVHAHTHTYIRCILQNIYVHLDTYADRGRRTTRTHIHVYIHVQSHTYTQLQILCYLY